MYSDEITKHIAEGAKLYAAKDFDQAASKYADACAAYNEENGADDADLLLLYGKALFQNGVAKSGVLGGVGNDTEEKKPNDADDEENDNFQFEEGFADDNESPENEDDDHDDQGGDQGEDQPDFEAAWEILDLARSLYEEKVEETKNGAENLDVPYLKKDDDESTSDYVVAVKKLAEVYDLLGEVSLESENFPQAASDLQSCLELRQKLYDLSKSALVSESHYKLSLALEFSVENPNLRKEAAHHMKLAIDCVRARAEAQTDEEAKKDAYELLRDLEERYKELEKEPQKEVEAQQMDMIKGLLGEAIGGTAGATDLTSLVKKAPVNDLSSMVKKRKPKADQGNEAKKPKKE